jgi:hypothetical protein
VRRPIPASDLLKQLATKAQIDGGISLSRFYDDRPNDFLVCVTEINTRQQIDGLIAGLAEFSTT